MERVRVPPSPYDTRRGYYTNPLFARTSSSGGVRSPPCPCPQPRRSRTTATQDYSHARTRRESEPWRQVAKTYAWVMEQDVAEMVRQNEDTVRWIRKQQERDRRDRTWFGFLGFGFKRRFVEEEIRVKARVRQETMFTKLAFDDAIEEELRRIQAQRREADRHRAAYERRKAAEEREMHRRREAERARREEEERAAWDRYESRWNELLSSEASSEPLTFESIPWPLTSPPRNVEDLRSARITMFILSSQHSRGQSMKDRVRHALRRWHPDRFGRILARVREEDRAMVEEGVGIVARCLNGLLERTA